MNLINLAIKRESDIRTYITNLELDAGLSRGYYRDQDSINMVVEHFEKMNIYKLYEILNDSERENLLFDKPLEYPGKPRG